MIVNGQISIDEITPDMPESEIKKYLLYIN